MILERWSLKVLSDAIRVGKRLWEDGQNKTHVSAKSVRDDVDEGANDGVDALLLHLERVLSGALGSGPPGAAGRSRFEVFIRFEWARDLGFRMRFSI